MSVDNLEPAAAIAQKGDAASVDEAMLDTAAIVVIPARILIPFQIRIRDRIVRAQN